MLVIVIVAGVLLVLGGLRVPGFALGFLQGRLDEPQHEFPLSELAPGAGGLPLQMGFDALEKGFVDLEGHGPGVVVRHSFVTPIFFHFEVFGQQVGDVLGGGEPRLLFGFADALMQVGGDLSAEILCGCHGVRLPSFDCEASIDEI